MVHTRLLRKFAVDRCLERKLAHVGCHGWVALWGSLVGGLGATRSSQQQPRAAQESPGELGELWGTSGRAQGDPEHPKHDTFRLGRLAERILHEFCQIFFNFFAGFFFIRHIFLASFRDSSSGP